MRSFFKEFSIDRGEICMKSNISLKTEIEVSRNQNYLLKIYVNITIFQLFIIYFVKSPLFSFLKNCSHTKENEIFDFFLS